MTPNDNISCAPLVTSEEPRWHWRNCREIGISVQFWPLSWQLGIDSGADVFGGEWRINLGPLMVALHANIGNCSSDNRFKAWIGLSEAEAYERAARFSRTATADEGEKQ